MSAEILSINALLSFLFIIASGYTTLLWSYRDADKLDYFYKHLKDFDKATQSTLIGGIIYFIGYFISPEYFFSIFSEGFSNIVNFYVIGVIEIFLIITFSSIFAGIIQKVHGKKRRRANE